MTRTETSRIVSREIVEFGYRERAKPLVVHHIERCFYYLKNGNCGERVISATKELALRESQAGQHVCRSYLRYY